jgi:hypothetical protein
VTAANTCFKTGAVTRERDSSALRFPSRARISKTPLTCSSCRPDTPRAYLPALLSPCPSHRAPLTVPLSPCPSHRAPLTVPLSPCPAVLGFASCACRVTCLPWVRFASIFSRVPTAQAPSEPQPQTRKTARRAETQRASGSSALPPAPHDKTVPRSMPKACGSGVLSSSVNAGQHTWEHLHSYMPSMVYATRPHTV